MVTIFGNQSPTSRRHTTFLGMTIFILYGRGHRHTRLFSKYVENISFNELFSFHESFQKWHATPHHVIHGHSHLLCWNGTKLQGGWFCTEGTESEGADTEAPNGHLFDEDGRKTNNMMSKHQMWYVHEAWERRSKKKPFTLHFLSLCAAMEVLHKHERHKEDHCMLTHGTRVTLSIFQSRHVATIRLTETRREVCGLYDRKSSLQATTIYRCGE